LARQAPGSTTHGAANLDCYAGHGAGSLLTKPTDPQVMRNWVRRVAGQDNEEVPVPVPVP